ncbi:MAG: 30S ribosomal protein S11, partial [Rhodobacteraceae bacterium]|nr:30S ribosomal protein S11 [Paracoccaceae bacterium]
GPHLTFSVASPISARINDTAIRDVTPIAHNGCRPPKRRRV